MAQEVTSELALTGVLRAAINTGNFLLVTERSPTGGPEGVAPDMAHEIATRLGVPVRYVAYARPGELADAAGTGVWDIGLIGAELQRAEKIAFNPACVEIEATYLVPADSPFHTIADVDRAGVRIAVTARTSSMPGSSDLRVAMRHSSNLSTTSSTHWPACARVCWRTPRNCPARASSTDSLPPCSRRSAPRAGIRLVRRSCAISSKRRRDRGSSHASSNATTAWAASR